MVSILAPIRSFTLWLGVLCAVVLSGCGDRALGKLNSPTESTRYLELPGAKSASDDELRAELARIEAERGLPAQLALQTRKLEPGVPDAEEVRERLAALFPADSRKRLGERLSSLSLEPDVQFTPLVRESARDLLRTTESLRQDYLRLVLRPLPCLHQHDRGIGADTTYVTQIELGNRLLALSYRELLEQERWSSAAEELTGMFRAAEWLSRESHPVPRSAAVHRRQESLRALATGLQHPRWPPALATRFLNLLTEQLAAWPADAQARWGERAEGLLVYELVRDGYLLSLIPFADLQKHRAEIGAEKLGQFVSLRLNADERFYLATLRRLVEASEVPYHARAAIFQALAADLEARRSSDEYPFVADQILLRDWEDHQRWAALDRVRCEAWQIALGLATGTSTSPPGSLNGFTGQPWRLALSPTSVRLEDVAPGEPPIEIPRFPR